MGLFDQATERPRSYSDHQTCISRFRDFVSLREENEALKENLEGRKVIKALTAQRGEAPFYWFVGGLGSDFLAICNRALECVHWKNFMARVGGKTMTGKYSRTSFFWPRCLATTPVQDIEHAIVNAQKILAATVDEDPEVLPKVG